MMDKRILPEGFNFDVPSVDIIECGRKGLDKQAMVKRASAFEDVIADIKPKPGYTYLHVITTGAMEKYGSNRNRDAFNEDAKTYTCPYPESPDKKTIKLDGGLKKWHDKSYMDKEAGVYQEHKTKDTDPSGYIVAAKYNDDMHRGELIIGVETEKWAPRLQKKASGQNIYLSMGCHVSRDVCSVCNHEAHTYKEHCDHFKKQGNLIMDDGTQSCVINDAPHFYDISGVDAPADRIAFVLKKVASVDQVKTAAAEALFTMGTRVPMLATRSARLLEKLAKMEKRVEAVVHGDGVDDDEDAFKDDDKAQKDFVLRVQNYPADEIIDGCNRKGILLSPGMLFKIIGKDSDSPELFEACDDASCGDCSTMMRDMLEDDENRNTELLDGSFDQHFPVDLNLDRILEDFMPLLGMTNPAVKSRSIHIVITSKRPEKPQTKEAAYTEAAHEALRRTYARYVISFADQNNDATCMNALRKIAGYGK